MSAMNMNIENFKALVQEEGKTAIIDFWAPWCGYCRRIGPAYDKVAQEREDILVAKVNVDDFPQLAMEFAIEVIPTMLLFKNGKVVDSIVAPESKSKIDSFIDENLGG